MALSPAFFADSLILFIKPSKENSLSYLLKSAGTGQSLLFSLVLVIVCAEKIDNKTAEIIEIFEEKEIKDSLDFLK